MEEEGLGVEPLLPCFLVSACRSASFEFRFGSGGWIQGFVLTGSKVIYLDLAAGCANGNLGHRLYLHHGHQRHGPLSPCLVIAA